MFKKVGLSRMDSKVPGSILLAPRLDCNYIVTTVILLRFRGGTILSPGGACPQKSKIGLTVDDDDDDPFYPYTISYIVPIFSMTSFPPIPTWVVVLGLIGEER